MLDVVVAGRGGVPADAIGAVLNVTIVEPCGDGFATVFPAGAPNPPLASNSNYRAFQNVAGLVTSQLGVGGAVNVYTQTQADIVVDVVGYIHPTQGQLFNPVTPSRLYDVRPARLGPGSGGHHPGARRRHHPGRRQRHGRGAQPHGQRAQRSWLPHPLPRPLQPGGPAAGLQPQLRGRPDHRQRRRGPARRRRLGVRVLPGGVRGDRGRDRLARLDGQRLLRRGPTAADRHPPGSRARCTGPSRRGCSRGRRWWCRSGPARASRRRPTPSR